MSGRFVSLAPCGNAQTSPNHAPIPVSRIPSTSQLPPQTAKARRPERWCFCAMKREIGVARFRARPDGHDREFAVTVSDEWQNRGLGTLLMRHPVARARGIKAIHSSEASDITLMRQFADHLCFHDERDADDATLAFNVGASSKPVPTSALG